MNKQLDWMAIASIIANEVYGFNGSDKTNPPKVGLRFAAETLKETVEYSNQLSVTETLETIDAKIAFLSLKYPKEIIQAVRDSIREDEK